MSDKIVIFDTTLRDGEQSPGATMTMQEKLTVAGMLDDMGVDIIEAGFGAASKGDTECIRAASKNVKNATICSLARGIRTDIEAAARAVELAKKPRIHTFISTSAIHIEHQFRMTYDQVLDIIDDTVRYARTFCDDVEWSAMDATRSDMAFLTKAVKAAVEAGAKTINLPDTVGYAMPSEYQDMFATLTKMFPQAIFSTHCHNDLGLATANSLAGVKGGARQIECTINGIGERAGNAALEEVVMALKTRNDYMKLDSNIDTQKLYPMSKYITAVTGFTVQKNKAIVGANAFAHESGIHQDGMLKNRNTYEIISPETVGVGQTAIVLGKHSGRAALKKKIAEWGLTLDDADLQKIFEDFKTLCDSKKYVGEDEILTLLRNKQPAHPPRLLELVTFTTTKNGEDNYTSDIVIRDGVDKKTYSATGTGPLDSLFNAINTVAGAAKPDLLNFDTHNVSTGTDAQAESNIVLTHDGKIYAGHARHADTIKSSALAYLSAISKIVTKGEAA